MGMARNRGSFDERKNAAIFMGKAKPTPEQRRVQAQRQRGAMARLQVAYMMAIMMEGARRMAMARKQSKPA